MGNALDNAKWNNNQPRMFTTVSPGIKPLFKKMNKGVKSLILSPTAAEWSTNMKYSAYVKFQ